MDFFLPIFIVYFSVCVPAFCSEWFHHLLEHFVVGNFPPLQILPLFCARPHQFLFMWFMGERKGASTSERNARNINSFINNTTKTFFFLIHADVYKEEINKQIIKKKTHWGLSWHVSKSTVKQHRPHGQVHVGSPSSTSPPWVVPGQCHPGEQDGPSITKEVGCHVCLAEVPAMMPAVSGLGR